MESKLRLQQNLFSLCVQVDLEQRTDNGRLSLLSFVICDNHAYILYTLGSYFGCDLQADHGMQSMDDNPYTNIDPVNKHYYYRLWKKEPPKPQKPMWERAHARTPARTHAHSHTRTHGTHTHTHMCERDRHTTHTEEFMPSLRTCIIIHKVLIVVVNVCLYIWPPMHWVTLLCEAYSMRQVRWRHAIFIHDLPYMYS